MLIYYLLPKFSSTLIFSHPGAGGGKLLQIEGRPFVLKGGHDYSYILPMFRILLISPLLPVPDGANLNLNVPWILSIISIHVYIMSVSVSPAPVSENRGGTVSENWGVPVSPKLEDFSKITMVQYYVPLPGDSRIYSIWIRILVRTRKTGPGWRIQPVRRWRSDIPMDRHI